MKYFLAYDLKKSKKPDKSDRYVIIDLEKICGLKLESIAAINEFTARFKNEIELSTFLCNHDPNLIKYMGKHFTICYQSPAKKNGIQLFTRCGFKCKDQSGVLFRDEARLFFIDMVDNSTKEFNPEHRHIIETKNMINELLDLMVKDEDIKDESRAKILEDKLAKLQLLTSEIKDNDFFEYDCVYEDASELLRYVHEIKRDKNLYNKYFDYHVRCLVNGVYHKYNRTDDERKTPLTDKKGNAYCKIRNFYEFVLVYVMILREIKARTLDRQPEIQNQTVHVGNYTVNTTTGEVIEDKKEEPKYTEGEQLSFFDIMNGPSLSRKKND